MTTRATLLLCATSALSGWAQAAPDLRGYEQCVSFPDAPGLHWPKAAVEAFCADSFMWVFQKGEVRALIDQGRGKDLDARLDQVLKDYFAGKLAEGAARRAFTGNFGHGDDTTGAMIERWLQQSPGSAYALAARGMHGIQRAADARGGKYFDETPPENFDRMEAAIGLANKDLTRAVLANPRLLPAFEALIDGGRMNGDEALAKTALEGALRTDPKNFYVRAEYLTNLQPRWGGSLEDMQKFAADAQRYLRKNPRLMSLTALALGERGYFPALEKDDRAALREYESALIAAPSLLHLRLAGAKAAKLGQHQRSVELYSQVLRFFPNEEYERTHRATAYARMKHFELARADLDHVLEVSPNYASALREYAYVHMSQGDYQGALEKLLRAREADAQDAWTLRKLAWIYIYKKRDARKAEPLVNELIRLEPKSGAAWLLRSDVIQNLSLPGLQQAAENFVRYADSSDEEQRKALPKVQAWLATQPRQ